ncbi:MAG: hypothetical protein ACO20X_14875 [Alphaproteobacteria bacterium]
MKPAYTHQGRVYDEKGNRLPRRKSAWARLSPFKGFFRGIRRIARLGMSEDWELLERTMAEMDEIKLHKILQLASTLHSQTQQNRDLLTKLQIYQEQLSVVERNTEMMAEYLLTLKENK